MEPIPIIPGRGLLTESAIAMRQQYLRALGHKVDAISNLEMDPALLQRNIESLIGSVEIPLGIVGPLLYCEGEQSELVHCAAASLEGALIASMNRGARAISLSGGFRAAVVHQKMVRAPLFIFENLPNALVFKSWVEKNFERVKAFAEQHSNHATLLTLTPFLIGRSVHVKFVYNTADASGQNMTTTCTWHAMLSVAADFERETGVQIVHFVLEGNGASDKKVSYYNLVSGRGTHVVAECFLDEDTIQKVLRTSSEAIFACFNTSLAMSRIDGMVGYNINVANAVAAIFAATGQDIASIHESATGVLNMEKTTEGLYLSLNLPNLVIGTVGGATHLPRQAEALGIMGCKGSGKSQRFACLIAGFALALELSTYAAIVSGAFAKAHEKLGRNKPINWLLRSEVTPDLVRAMLLPESGVHADAAIQIMEQGLVENGIITTLTNRVSRKLIGFIPVDVTQPDGTRTPMLLKSKATDIEVVKGLHLMAASIDPELSDLLNFHRGQMEYNHCHLKEIRVYEMLHEAGFSYMPAFYGSIRDSQREIYLLLQERLDESKLLHINSQKSPEIWTDDQIKNTLIAIGSVHKRFQGQAPEGFVQFKPWEALPLYRKLVEIMYLETEEEARHRAEYVQMRYFLEELQTEFEALELPLTLIHNDFNSRNIAMRAGDLPCIYDWELAVLNIPHRDVVEFLSFVLPSDFEPETLHGYFRLHHQICGDKIPYEKWVKAYRYALKEYLITRIAFYEVAGILAKYAFADRVRENAFRFLGLLNAS